MSISDHAAVGTLDLMQTSALKSPLEHVSARPEPKQGALTVDRVTSLAVGASAALEHAQLAHIHLFTVVAAFWLLRRKRLRIDLRGSILIGAAALLASTVLYGPLVNSTQTGLQFALLATCGGLIASNADRREIDQMLDGYLAVVVTAAGLAWLQYIHILPLTAFNGEARPSGIIYSEPDFLGTYAMVALILVFWRPMTPYRRGLLISVFAVAIIMTAARAAWLGAVAGLLLTLVVHIRSSRQRANGVRVVRWIVGLSAVIFVVLAVSPPLRNSVEQRIQSAITGNVAVNATSAQAVVSAQARRNQQATLWQLAATSPWYGQGFTASGRVMLFGGVYRGGASPSNISSNWMLSWWVEGAYLAIPIVLVFLYAVYAGWSDATGAALLGLLVANLFSNATLFPVTLFLVGLSLSIRRPRRREDPGAPYITDEARFA